MNENPYKSLAERLDALPNGFPPTADGAELRLLVYLYTPEQAALAALCIIHATHTLVFDPPKAREYGLAALEQAQQLDNPAAEARAVTR